MNEGKTRNFIQSSLVVFVIGAMLLLAASPKQQFAFADTVQNNASAIHLQKNGASIAVGYHIDSSPKGCSTTSTNLVTIHLNGYPSGVNVSPASLTFNQCGLGDEQNFTFTATNSATVGKYSVTVVVDSGTGITQVSPGSINLFVEAGDTTPPVITVPSDITREATSSSGATVTYTASANDAVDGSVAVVCTPASGSTFPLGTTTVSCTAHDAAGNTATATFHITVQDTTAPIVTVPASQTVEATSGSGATATYSGQSATDLVDGSVSVVCTPASGSTFPLGDNVVTCTATDAHGNTGSATFHINVVDTTAPIVTVPASQTVEATSGSGATATYSGQSATDLVDGSVSVVCTPASGSTFAIGSTTVTCSATDSHGNTGSNSFIVTVQDHTGPTIVVTDGDNTPVSDLESPGHIVVEATGPTGASAAFSASANDAVDGPTNVSCDYISGQTFALGSTTVTCTSTDSHGNTSTSTFVIDVVDTTAPTIAPMEDMVVEATGPSGAQVTFSGSSTDLVDVTDPVVCTPTSGSTFAITTTTVTCDATDAHNNHSSTTFHIKVQDTTAPTVTLPSDITAEATSADGAVVTFTATASDIVDPSPVVSCTPTSGSTFALGENVVTCDATDLYGNTSDPVTFNITVEDKTGPVITPPNDVTVEATGPDGAIGTYSGGSALDAVDGPVEIVCTPASGSQFALGDNLISCSATDESGNTSTATFHVHVVDTTAPVITAEDVYATLSGATTTPVNFAPTAQDLVDGSVPVVCDPVSGTSFGLGTTAVSCTATDAAGNPASASFNVIVSDVTAPVITPNISGTLGDNGWYVSPVALSWTIVDPESSITSTSGCAPVTLTADTPSVSFNCSATSAGGTSTVNSGNIKVDMTAPTITPGTNTFVLHQTATINAACNDATSGIAQCTLPTVTTSVMGAGTTTVSAKDNAGNTGSQSVNYSVVAYNCVTQTNGFLSPVPNTQYKLGRDLPLKFVACDLQNHPVSGVVANAQYKLSTATSWTNAVSGSSSTTGNLFRYDPSAGQYIFNMVTDKLTIKNQYDIRAVLDSGQIITTTVTFTK